MSNTVLSWRNWVFYYQQSLLTGGAVTVNDIENIRDAQLSTLATMINLAEPEGEALFSVTFSAKDDTGANIDVPIDVVGLLSVRGLVNVDQVENLYVLIKNAANVTVFESDSAPYLLSAVDGFNPHVWLMLPATVQGHSVFIEIQTQGGGLVNHTISIGGMWVGPSFSTGLGLEEGWSCEVKDVGEMGKSIGQQGFPQVKRRYRSLTAQYAPFDRAAAYGNPLSPEIMDAQRLMFEVGTTGFCAFFPNTKDELGIAEDRHIIHRLGCYGHFESFGAIAKLTGNSYSWGQFTFKELM